MLAPLCPVPAVDVRNSSQMSTFCAFVSRPTEVIVKREKKSALAVHRETVVQQGPPDSRPPTAFDVAERSEFRFHPTKGGLSCVAISCWF